MPKAHRHNDTRFCGATTIVQGQSNVYVNGKLWAVEGDPNTHIQGNLVSVVGSSIKINGKRVIVIGDTALADLFPHDPPLTRPIGTSPDVSAY